jgi:hypothetical protein
MSKDRANPGSEKLPLFFNMLRKGPAAELDSGATSFLPGGKICRPGLAQNQEPRLPLRNSDYIKDWLSDI